MAIKLETIKGLGQIARVYDCTEPEPMAPFCAVFVFEWEDARTVWIKAMHGRLTRRTLRELVQTLVDKGAHVVKALRAEGHVLPLGVTDAAGVTTIRVADLVERFARPGASDWVPLAE